MTPDAILPATSFAAGLCCLAAAMLLAYVSNRAHGLRQAFYGMLSLGLTLAGAAAIFGNLIATLTRH